MKPARARGFALVAILIVIALVIGIGTVAYFKFLQKTKPPTLQNTEKQITSKSAENLNPNTGNLYEDIKIRLKEELK